MHKLLTGLAAAAALTLTVSAASADCGWHNQVTADKDQPQEAVTMSTHDGAPAPVVATDEKPAATPVCPEGETCPPASE